MKIATENLIELLTAERFKKTPRSFIREILKVTAHPNIISFAGGLPNPAFFPVREIERAAVKVMKQNGRQLLQYGETEGYRPLREYIAARYDTKYGLTVRPDEILITNGSQQGLDLIGKVFLNPDDHVLVERPTYLGAIQAFSVYGPQFVTVGIENDGVNCSQLSDTLNKKNIKLFYGVPNFQNPTGISYSLAKRKSLGEIMKGSPTLFIEDDPYGEIRFSGDHLSPVKSFLPEQTILLGSFSKTISPGMRMGWIVASEEIIQKLLVAKQAADLHSNNLSQRVICQYVLDNDFNEHISKITNAYKKQHDWMQEAINTYFPSGVKATRPEGGMFLWITLGDRTDTMELFNRSIKENVAFVPGSSFYAGNDCHNTMRLNFSNSDEQKIENGIKILGRILNE
jgi:2-aminoadipate transaminase